MSEFAKDEISYDLQIRIPFFWVPIISFIFLALRYFISKVYIQEQGKAKLKTLDLYVQRYL